MHSQPRPLRAFAYLTGVALLAFASWASADPPSRVARLAYLTGAVGFSPAGESDWVQARINRPLTTGDRLWSEAGARVEIQVGGAVIRMNAGTGLSVLNLDDRLAQLRLTQGTVSIRVRHLESDQVFELNTPNLAFSVRQPGDYRIEVDPEHDATTIVVRRGQGEVYGEGASYLIDSRQPYRFTGTDLREYHYADTRGPDEFDRWASDRDRRYDSSVSARYVSQDVVGYEDLDASGTWRLDATYGNVWFPNRVVTGWAPYRDGHWAWIDPWGWTWIDDAPWGFAVSHYGRWANLRGTWGWIPGPVRTRAYYAPALVVFVGGDDFRISISSGNVGALGWFPLGPREVYRPAYPVSRRYFENLNRSNTVVNTTIINNYYDSANVTNVVYANRQVPGAVIAVPTTTFVQSQPVARAAVRMSREMIVSAPLALVAPVAPTERSVRGAAAPRDQPPPRVFERPVVARTAPPAPPVGFAAQQRQLDAKPGKPLDDAARTQLKPAAAAPAPSIKLVAPTHTAPPTALPPRAAPGARPADARGKSDDRMAPAGPPITGAPGPAARSPAAAPPVAPKTAPPAPPTAAPQLPRAPAAQPPEQRGRPEQRGKAEERGQPVAPPPPSPKRAAEPRAVPPQVAPPAPAMQPTPQRAAQPKLSSPPQAARPAPTAEQPAQRARPAPAAAVKQAEPRPPGTAPHPPVAAPKPTPPQPGRAPKAEPRGQEPKPAAGKRDDNRKDGDEQKRDDQDRQKKG